MDSPGVQIREARKALGLSQAELARRLGLTRARVQQIEKSPGRLSEPNVRRFSKELGVSIENPLPDLPESEAELRNLAILARQAPELMAKSAELVQAINRRVAADNTFTAWILEYFLDRAIELAEDINDRSITVREYSAVDLWVEFISLAQRSVRAVHTGTLAHLWDDASGAEYGKANEKVARRLLAEFPADPRARLCRIYLLDAAELEVLADPVFDVLVAQALAGVNTYFLPRGAAELSFMVIDDRLAAEVRRTRRAKRDETTYANDPRRVAKEIGRFSSLAEEPMVRFPVGPQDAATLDRDLVRHELAVLGRSHFMRGTASTMGHQPDLPDRWQPASYRKELAIPVGGSGGGGLP